ncbi:MAG: glycoside hydrolase family 3 protein [Alphaproteobacteria bacterium]|nr:glycoside hydrolase family 3 protein [Alphaproteobacteria bacterium]
MKPILPAFLSVQGAELSEGEKHLLAKYNPLGVCMFAIGCANVQNKGQLQQLTKQIKETIGRDNVLIAVDQEGGRVRRLTEPEWTPVASQAQIKSVETAVLHAKLISRDLKQCGINVNFAPVLDVLYPETNAVLKSRCFNGTPEKVAKWGAAMVKTYEKCGICPCVKHLPGHGRGLVDPHLQLPIIDATLAELATDFYPFEQLKNAPMGMAAHIILKAVDTKNPATCSAKVIKNIIRQKIGFGGFLVSDAIVMRSLKGSIIERAQKCLAAGCDAVCLGNADFAANEALCESGITLSEEALERLQKVEKIIARPLPRANYEYLQNKYCRRLKNIISYNSEYDATEVLSRLRKK